MSLETCVWIGASPVARKLRSRMVAAYLGLGNSWHCPAARRPQRLSHRLVLALPSWARQWRSFSRERAAYTALGCAPPPKRRAGVAARRCCPSQAGAPDPGPARAPLTKAHRNQSRNASHKRRGGQEAEALPSCTTAIRASAGTAIRPADGCNRRPQYVPAALLGTLYTHLAIQKSNAYSTTDHCDCGGE